MGGIRIRMDVSVCFQSICRFCFRAVSVAVVGVSCFSAQASPHPAFEHCRTDIEKRMYSEYMSKGPHELFDDFTNSIRWQLPDVVVKARFPKEKMSSCYISNKILDAMKCIFTTDVGKQLFSTLLTKMQLKKDALNVIGDGISSASQLNIEDQNRAISRLLRVFFYQPNGTSLVEQYIPAISEVITRVTRENDWEYRSQYVIDQSFSVMGSLQTDDVMYTLGSSGVCNMLSEIQQAIDNVDIRISSIQGAISHAFTWPNNVPFINIDFSKEGQYEAVSCISSQGESRLEKRDSLLDEILFHELGHALHWIENRNDIVPSIDTMLINGKEEGIRLERLWTKAEEFRNNTGYVFVAASDVSASSDVPMSDSLGTSTSDGALIFMDSICTFIYDLQSMRKPRWPYLFIGSVDETGLAEWVYKDHLLLN